MIEDLLLAALCGILEGVTEWLPISSTGHLILLSHFLKMPTRAAFFELFEVVIQLGAILAVPVIFWKKLCPLGRGKTSTERAEVWRLWGLVLIAVLPSAILGLLLDDLLDTYFYNATVVAVMLILYGVLFILLEKRKKRTPSVGITQEITAKTALFLGLFQLLSLIPGTSRSGATILGGLLLGLSRTAAAEFSFFLGIPTMMGASLLKAGKFFLEGSLLTPSEWLMLAVGTLTAFLVSLLTIRALLDFVRRHSFLAFGIYRILLGIAVILLLL